MHRFSKYFAEPPQRQRLTALILVVTTYVSYLFTGLNDNRDELPITRSRADVYVPNCMVSNLVAASLLHQATRSSQATTSGYSIELPLSFSPIEEVVMDVDGAIRDQPDIGGSHTSPVGQAIITSSTNLTQSESEMVISNDNAEIRETDVDMSDTLSLLPLTPVATQVAPTSSHRQDPRSLPHENSYGVSNAGSRVPSQYSEQPPVAERAIDIGALIAEAKEVGNWVSLLSVGGIFSALSGVIGNEHADLLHKYLFKTSILLSYASLSLGVGLLGLIKLDPMSIPGFVNIVKITIYISKGSLFYAASFAVCNMFPSKVGVGLILVAPVLPTGLVLILRCTRRDQRLGA